MPCLSPCPTCCSQSRCYHGLWLSFCCKRAASVITGSACPASEPCLQHSVLAGTGISLWCFMAQSQSDTPFSFLEHVQRSQAATMTSKQDVMAAGDAFHQAHASLGCINAALPLTRKQARAEMQGVPRYPARCSWS